MDLLDIIHRALPPEPFGEDVKIPWDDPAFSARMLREHLSQEHDLASRRGELIDQTVDWLHHQILGGRPTRVLDLGCGPGLYLHRLAERGHRGVGLDFGPASIDYATTQARAAGHHLEYRLTDIRTADFGTGFGLVCLLYGELNVFRPAEARRILARCRAALEPGGALVLEPHTFAAVRAAGSAAPTFGTAETGLLAAGPHVWLCESFWHEAARVATTRWYVLEPDRITRLGQAMQAYSDEEYQAMLNEAGFASVEYRRADDADAPLFHLVAR